MDQAPPPDFPLRHDPALLDSILGSLEDVVWSASAADAQALYLSPGAQKVFGRAPSDLDTAAKWLDAIHPDDREQVERWRQARCDMERAMLEYRIVRPDGEVRWVRDRCYTARDASGAAVRYDGILTDITEHKRMEEALRQSETRLSEIAENMTDLIIETDLNAVVLYASPSFKTVLGYDPQTLIGRSTFDLGIIHPDDAARAAQIGAEQAQLALTGANEAWRLEQRLRHSDGHYLCVEHATRFLRDERGQIVGVLTVARDMTDRRRTEKALRQRAEELTALYETSLEVSAQTDLNALLQAIVERAARLVGARMGGLYLIQPDGQTLKLVVSHYLPGDYTGTELRLGEGLSGRVAQTGEPMLIEDYRLWDDRARAFDDVPFRRVLGVPLKVRHEVIGVINVTDDERGGPFSEDEVRLVQLFADQAAVAIENAQLFEATRRQLEELTILHAAASAGMEATSEDDLIARAMQIISAIFYPGNLSVLLLDEATSVLHPHRSSRGLSKEGPPRTRQLGEGVIGQVAQFGRSQRLVDIRLTPEALPLGAKTCAVLCVPLKIGDRAVGVINVESPEPDAFDEADEQLLTTLAEQLAIGLSRQRSEAAEREARALAEALQRTASALNSTLDFDEVLDRVLAQLGHIVPHDAAGFMLLEPESGLVRVARGHGYPDAESIMQSRFPVAEAPDLRQMIEVGQPLVVPDTRVVPGWVRSSIAQWARSYTAAPVRVKGQVIGFLHVASRTPGAFTWAHADRLQVFADQTAIAIQNAQLFEAAQRQLVQQRALLTASQAISSSLDLATVLSRVAEQIGRAIDVTSVYIRDWDMETDNSRVLAEYYGPDASPAERVSDLGVIYNVQRDFGEEAARLVRAGRVIAYHVDDPGAPELMRRYLQQYGGQTELDIPLIVRNTVIGYAELWDSRRQRDFTPDEIALAQGIAQQAAVAIENARLFGETRNRAERLALINEISATVNSQLDLNAILQATADSLARALSISEVGLALLDDDSRRLIVMADHTAPGLASMAGVELRVEDGSSLERILAAKRPLAIMDAQTDPLLADLRDLAAERRAQSLLIVPLLVRGEAIGFIVCHEIDAPRQFSAEEIELAETIANLVAARIEQAHLLDAERQRRREIEAIQQASLSLTASLELPQVLTVILSTVSTLVPLEDTHIFFYDGERLTFAAAVTPRGRLDRAVIEPRPGGFTHTVARTGQSMIIEDVSQHPLPIGAPPDRAGAVIGLPLTIDSTVVGVMNVYFPTTRRIPESERRVLSLLA
ncbi:MAG TPA: GAF domain-containing protein, partial [Anaerolineae bacterium]